MPSAREIKNKRDWVKSAYEGQRWSDKVDKMSDLQVFAVYANLKRQNKI